MANNYDINYDDQRFKEVEADKKAALAENEKLYGGMVGESDKYYQAQIDASKQWADTQTKLQQEQTDFAISKIDQEKEQAKKDYTKEQSGAYVDWQKQSNEYGVNAEQAAAQGMQNTGWSESSQVSMYNTYQNRVATARESYNKIVMDFNNQMTEARLQNNSILAEIAYETQKQQLELNLEAFNHKNSLLIEQANKKLEIDNNYYNRYQDVLDQINAENALAEQIRQYNEKMAEEKRQFNKNYDLQIKQYNEDIRQFNEEIARLKAKDKQEYQVEIKQLELEKKKLEEEKRQFEASMAEEKRQFDKQYSASKTSSSSSTKSSGTKKSSSTEESSNTKKISSSYNNSGYSSSVVKQAQAYVGASADGKWGANSAAAAKKKGYSSLAAVVKAMGGHGVNKDIGNSSNKSFEKQVLDLNQGPISASNLLKQVNSGKVKVSANSKGKTTVKYNNPTSQLLYSKLRF